MKTLDKLLGTDKMLAKRRPGRPRKVDIKPNVPEITLDQVNEFLITKLEDAARVPNLLNRIASYENQHSNDQVEIARLQTEIARLEKYYREKEDLKRRFELARQQGDIASDLTYQL